MKKFFSKLPIGVRITLVALMYIVIVAAHIGLVYSYNYYFADKINSKNVVVAVKEIPIHTLITEDDVAIMPVNIDNIVEGSYVSLNDVIGMESQTKLVPNEQIHDGKLSEKVKEEGEIIIELPQEWVISFPKSIRRHDVISIMPIEDASRIKEIASFNGEISEEMRKEEERKIRAAALIEQAKESLADIKVVYFKDNTANDITNDSPNVTNSSENENPRVNASNLGTRLEVAVTPEQWAIIQGLYETKHKFVVGYQ